jgi:hypothetical protein
MRHRGPYCAACGHEYRSKDSGTPELAGLFSMATCPYCGLYGPVVNVRPFTEVSKSAIELWEMCPSAFFFKRIKHLPEPKNKYAAFGIVFHKMAEDWYEHGKMPVVNDLAPKSDETRAAKSLLAAIPLMPPPNFPGLVKEAEFHYEFEGVRYAGWKDVWAPLGEFPKTHPNAARFFDGTTILGDWKTTGDFKWAMSPEDLAQDIQVNIESYDDVRRGAGEVRLNWVYALRGERVAMPVRRNLTPDTVYARMREINETSKRVVHLLTSPPDRSNDLPTNKKVCKKFYGAVCPFIASCHVTEADRAFAELEGFELVKSSTGGQTMTQPQFPPAQAPNAVDALMGMVGTPPQGAPYAATTQAAPTPQVAPQPAPGHTITIAGYAPFQVPPGMYRVGFNGQQHDLPAEQVQNAINAGATWVGPVNSPGPQAAPPPATPPTAAMPQAAPPGVPTGPGAGAAINPGVPTNLPPPAATAPATPPAAAQPGRKPGTKRATTPAAPGAIDYAALAGAIVDELVSRLGVAQ